MTPKITIILLTCNRTAYVREALAGLLAQTYTDWTLTASDCSIEPGPRAELREILEEHRRNDPAHETHLLQQPGQVSQGEHLRRALLDVTTPYVALLDDDDVWMPDHLSRAVAWLEQSPRHGLAVSNGRIIDAASVPRGYTNSREARLPLSEDRHAWWALFMNSFFGSTSGYVFRREAIANHTFYSTSMVDIHLALVILLNDYCVTGFHQPTYFYRIHGGSSYEKGRQVTRDRHVLRLWLFRHQGLRIIRKFPVFFLYVVKSAGSLARDAVAGAGPRKKVKPPA